MNNIEKVTNLFTSDLSIVNIGLEGFHDSVEEQGIESTQLDWRPPAGGNTKLIEILEKLNR